jgi:hypothetical protein
MDLTQLSTTELKALGYEQTKERDRITQNLAVIEAELINRQSQELAPPAEDAAPVANPAAAPAPTEPPVIEPAAE